MSAQPIVVSHFTINTPYEKEVENLRASLQRLHLEHWLVGIQSLGTWRLNSNWCASQVQQALQRYPDRNILRVDADAVFQRRPILFEDMAFTADVAAHIHDFRWHRNELLGGTMFFRNNAKVQSLVDKWATECCETKTDRRNGDLLQQLLAQKSDIAFQSLPATYCKIFDLMRDVKQPVIEHFQASRRFKNIVNRGTA